MKIKVYVEAKVIEENGKYFVALIKYSVMIMPGRESVTSPPTEYGRRQFTTKKEADEDCERLNDFFQSR